MTDVKYAMHRIRLLKHFGIVPYVVFDGGLLPSKMGTENDRDRWAVNIPAQHTYRDYSAVVEKKR
jgi:hypothetical protein